MDSNKKIMILLLTNRDSDNVGDQVIEASDIGLLHALMMNLGFDKSLVYNTLLLFDHDGYDR